MAKVVLVWNEHPTEVVAGFHCRKVAEILKKKYGHEVVIEKIPAKETNYGIVTKEPDKKTALQKLNDLKHSIDIAKEYADKHNTFAFNFHASPTTAFEKATIKSPKKFQVGQRHPQEWGPYPFEITFENIPGTAHFVVEVPAEVRRLPEKLKEKNEAELHKTAMEQQLSPIIHSYAKLSNLLRRVYFTEQMGLKNPGQRRYLKRMISEKIAYAIHKRITAK